MITAHYFIMICKYVCFKAAMTCCSRPRVAHILQDVDTMPVDVSSMPAQSSPLVQFAVSATATLVRSRNRRVKNDVLLMNARQNAWQIVILLAQDSGLPDPIRTMHETAIMTSACLQLTDMEMHVKKNS